MSGDSAPAEPERFYACVLTLMEVAKDASVELAALGKGSISAGMIDIARNFLAHRDRNELIQLFIREGHEECWDKVKTRDDRFFLENAERLFGKVRGFDLNLFQDVFQKDANGNFLLSADLIEDVWLNLESMVRISINYVHNQRNPGQVSHGNTLVNCYHGVFFNDVNLSKHAINWNMTLNFTR